MTTLSVTDRFDEPAAVKTGAAMVHAGGLGVRLGDRQILRDIELTIRPRTMLVLLGANGAGKSTLLGALATLTPVTGKLELFGQTVNRDAAALRARIGMIGHQPMLYRDLTARENLVFIGDLYGVAQPQARAMQLLQRVGLADRAEDAVKTFSRGMTQRVAIARALMHEPELLLADEPFSGLDLASIDKLEALLDELRHEGKAIIVAHHDIAHALRFADEVAVMRRGRMTMHKAAAQLDEQALRQEVLA